MGLLKRECGVMSLDPANAIQSALIHIKNYLETEITDPKVGSRPAGSNFVMTAYPSRATFYPHIIVQQPGGSGTPEAVNAPISFQYDMLFSIDVMSRSTKELDEICGEILADMLDNVDGFISFGMHAMRMPLFFRPIPITERGVHQKHAEYSFLVYISQTV